MRRVILFGAPGVGKGTQADYIEQKFGFIKISTGDLIRSEVAARSPIGCEVETLIKKGELVPDTIIIDLLKNRLMQDDLHHSGGYIMDGFPRTIPQAEELSRIPVDSEIAVFLDVHDENELIHRIMSRLTCTSCSAIFNLENNPPKKNGFCDECGSKLVQRTDDNEVTIHNRIQVYRDHTQPVIDYYRQKGFLHLVDASKPIDDVSAQVLQVIR